MLFRVQERGARRVTKVGRPTIKAGEVPHDSRHTSAKTAASGPDVAVDERKCVSEEPACVAASQQPRQGVTHISAGLQVVHAAVASSLAARRLRNEKDPAPAEYQGPSSLWRSPVEAESIAAARLRGVETPQPAPMPRHRHTCAHCGSDTGEWGGRLKKCALYMAPMLSHVARL